MVQQLVVGPSVAVQELTIKPKTMGCVKLRNTHGSASCKLQHRSKCKERGREGKKTKKKKIHYSQFRS